MLTVRFSPSVQWSTHPDFLGACGELEVRDAARKRAPGDEFGEMSVTVPDCPASARCFFRVAAGNLAGYGAFKTTLPASVVLSGSLANGPWLRRLLYCSFLLFLFSVLTRSPPGASWNQTAWRAIDGRKPRFAGRLPVLDDLFSKVRAPEVRSGEHAPAAILTRFVVTL